MVLYLSIDVYFVKHSAIGTIKNLDKVTHKQLLLDDNVKIL